MDTNLRAVVTDSDYGERTAGSLQLRKYHVELLALTMLLQTVGKAEGIVQFVALKHIESSAKHDFPAVVGGDIAVVLGASGVEGPRKLDADASAGIGHLLKVLGLALACYVPQ
jgi:hypothetical protein